MGKHREDGSVFSIGKYKNDLKRDWIYFHRSGNIFHEGSYKNSFKNGQWVYYYEDGEPMR